MMTSISNINDNVSTNGNHHNYDIANGNNKNIKNDDLNKKLNEICDNLLNNYKETENKIEQHFELLSTYLNKRKNDLLDKLKQIYNDKYVILNNQLNNNNNNNENNDDNNNYEKLIKIPLENEYIDFYINDNDGNSYYKYIDNYGEIIYNNVIPLNCTITGTGLMQSYVNQDSSFTLSCRNINNELINTHGSFISTYIEDNNDSNKKINCNLEYLINGVFVIRYKLDKEGVYTLNVLINDQHVANSPYKLKCYDINTRLIKLSKQSNVQLMQLQQNAISKQRLSITNNSNTNNNYIPKSVSFSQQATNGSYRQQKSAASSTSSRRNTSTAVNSAKIILKQIDNNTTLQAPTSVSTPRRSVSHNDEALSLHSNSNILNSSIINQNDDLNLIIGTKGRSNGGFSNPQSVCFHKDYIYATDSNNQIVNVFSVNGEFRFSFGDANANHTRTNENINGSLRRPIGIVSTLNDRILVADYEGKCVNIYDVNGKYLSKIGQNKLVGPKGICLSPNGDYIIVADCKANCICIFNLNGKFISRFGNYSSIAAPQHIACKSNNEIVVTDFYNHCVKIFDINGNYKTCFGSNGSDDGLFNGPTGIFVDKYDNIIVSDWGNSRIQIFDKNGKFIKCVNSEINELYGPQGLAVSNNLYMIAIADSGNHCIKLFNYL